jgi:hypothetical protein
MDWCRYCGELDEVGFGLYDGFCDKCGMPWPSYPPPQPEPPRDLILDAEIFGVGRDSEGVAIKYFRLAKSDERLAALRSMPYADYLETPEWFTVRMTALAVAGGRCEVCNTEAPLDVHHRTYDRLGEEVLEDLSVLCRECHERFHAHGQLVPGGDPPPVRRVQFVIPAAVLG